ncbi:MAG: putative polysaccharide biosynthesis protein [Bacillota bacterium]|uniref:Polysaccharide biosynthesis protein n=2 Tax=Virgibacillus salarius TaxID=447199 RepID=A0A941IBH3_9BACI|nr:MULTISPECIES: polysaccharide biosynthesis protein [Bacillaceae]NAZ10457.1 oligosaccharide flippase family protein [Agaribacter marinus]MBR7797748.1 polysaccharide biosynthesis protein [Virgibacillus salarius]MCC2250095.1 polysaccharide biosynthesis protein [Virgibacillus sp. AGTR]MDY7046258.1 polysaccharide biosynthesis protein [Virgibacillus sp. M23]QRZ17755.1 polysaccharide biosynthesis protein [Virgibacillus sp. AGTR]
MSNIVRGTMLLTGASFLSKFLGMIYVVPFNALVGPSGGTLFAYAYTPYSIFISLSTVGVPLAVSKFVSKYNAVGDYETGMRMFRTAMTMMMVTGIFAFLAMFFSAEWLASGMITSDDPANITVSDVAFVIRMVSFALIIIPVMSIVRGFFQGHNSMGPTAISQVMEQIVRIVFLLGGSFIILKILNGSELAAVGFSTFAAFLGAVASCLVLWIYWNKRKSHLYKQIEQQTYSYDIPKKDLFLELFRYAGPFVLVGLAIPLYQLVDQFTFERSMVASGNKEIWEFTYSVINFYGHKLVIIPITLATGLSLAILPELTKSYTQNNSELLTKQINQALQIIMVLVIPAVVGLSLLSDEAYGTLFGELDKLAISGPLLAWYAPVALFFALFSVTSSVLQAINQQRFAVVSLLAGLLVKVLFNIQLIYVFGAKGAIFGTALAAGIAVSLNLWRIRSSIDFSYKQLIKRTILIGIFAIIMSVCILILKALLGMVIPNGRWGLAIILTICVIVGGSVYLWFAYHSTLLERVLGKRVRVLDKLFRR